MLDPAADRDLEELRAELGRDEEALRPSVLRTERDQSGGLQG
jgi:hypothetical protein